MMDKCAVAEGLAILERLEEQLEGAVQRLTEINIPATPVKAALDQVSRARNTFELLLTDSTEHPVGDDGLQKHTPSG